MVEHYFINHEQEVWYRIYENGGGFCKIYRFIDEKYLVFSELSVSENLRKKGLGNKILNDFFELGKKNNIKEFWLWVDKNSFVKKWYERKGFVEDAQYEDRESDVWMVLKLE